MKNQNLAITVKQLSYQYQAERYSIAYALILIMIGIAGLFQKTEIILPEFAALAIGCFVYRNASWLEKPWHLFLIPSATAIVGFWINQLDISISVKLIIIVISMFIMLRVFKVALGPALATGLLPIITNCNSLLFIASILFFMFVLAFIVSVFLKQPQKTEGNRTDSGNPFQLWIYLALLITWIIFCSVAHIMEIAAFPPVIVTGYESIHKKEYTNMMFSKQIAALIVAALIGSLTIQYIDSYLLCALINCIGVTLTLKALNFKMGPAYAMALLPMILHTNLNIYFSLKVGLMALVILGTVRIYKKIA